jgi:hypothetical protein
MPTASSARPGKFLVFLLHLKLPPDKIRRLAYQSRSWVREGVYFCSWYGNFCVAKVNASEAEREDEEDEEENRRRTFIRSKIVLPR